MITYNQYWPCQKTGPVRGSTMDKIITISREYGAGGHSIGQQVAKELGIPFYDRDILKATVQTSGFDPDMVEHDQEDVSSTNFFFKSICSFADASFSDTQDAIHDVQKAVILHLSERRESMVAVISLKEYSGM